MECISEDEFIRLDRDILENYLATNLSELSSFKQGRIDIGRVKVRCGILQRIMANILCKSVFNIFELFDTLDQLQTKLRDQARSSDHKVRLLVIDSISSVIAPILGGNMAYGRSLMISAGFLLKRIAYEHNLSVLVTNHMVGGNVGSLKPALGESWKGVAHTRLLLSRVNRTNKCSISVLKHPSMARGNSVDFLIPEENF